MPNKPMLVVSRPIYFFFSSFGLGLLCGVLILLSACVTRVRFLNISDGVVGRRANLCSHRIRVFNFVYVNHIMDWGFYAWATPLLAMMPKPMARMCKT